MTRKINGISINTLQKFADIMKKEFDYDMKIETFWRNHRNDMCDYQASWTMDRHGGDFVHSTPYNLSEIVRAYEAGKKLELFKSRDHTTEVFIVLEK